MKIKNVIIACDYAYFEGGAANVAMQTVIALAKYTNYNIFCFAGCGEPCEELKKSGAKIVALRLPDLLGNKNKLDAFVKGIYNKKVEREMLKLLKSLNPADTIVHIHTWTKVLSSAVFNATEKCGYTTFLTVHEYFLACPNGACFDYKTNEICERNPLSISCLMCNCDARNYPQKIWRCIRQHKQNRIIRRNKYIRYIFISEFEKKQLLRRIPDVKYKCLVKNPITIGDRKRINVENNCDFIYVGRLSGEKGIKLFCDSVTKAEVSGVVIGDGYLANELKSEYRNIKFVGWLSKNDLYGQLTTARALIFPSLWYEGSPLTVPEVQAYGIPCIVTDCSAAIDDIKDGRNGLIVRPDTESVISAVKKFQNNNFLRCLSEFTFNNFDDDRASNERYAKDLDIVYQTYYEEGLYNE